MQLWFSATLVLTVMFVNGWTDAPNAITGVVSTGTLSFRRAAVWAAVCELAGVMIMSALCPTVAETVFYIADFGSNLQAASMALQSALLAIVLWAVLAWRFGIPTSESHALIAGLTGSALALHGGFDGVSASAWGKVLAGLALSTLCGGLCGRWAVRKARLWNCSQRKLRRGQIACAGAMAFLHGAQDGQKFLALFLLAQTLETGGNLHVFHVSPSLALLCAVTMGSGVLCGGRRIVDTISQGMTGLTAQEGLAADLAGACCLFAASALGLPVSTTHTKISAFLGASFGGKSPSAWSTARGIITAWIATFPCCALLSWLLTKLMLQ